MSGTELTLMWGCFVTHTAEAGFGTLVRQAFARRHLGELLQQRARRQCQLHA
jgi:hypothetical protein